MLLTVNTKHFTNRSGSGFTRDGHVLTERVGCKRVKSLFTHLSHSTEVGLAAHS